MKNKRQYRDSAMFTLAGYVGILIVGLAMVLVIGSKTGFNEEIQEGLQNDPRPANRLINYMVLDSIIVKDTLTQKDTIWD